VAGGVKGDHVFFEIVAQGFKKWRAGLGIKGFCCGHGLVLCCVDHGCFSLDENVRAHCHPIVHDCAVRQDAMVKFTLLTFPLLFL
jgi:hypothetical protein